MNICIFGLGYVGCVTGACLAQIGHNVIGVDNNQTKVAMINNGQSPIVEKDINKIINKMVKDGRFTATMDYNIAIEKSDISMLCVGTPSNRNGSLNLNAIQKVSEEIGRARKEKKDYHVIVNRRPTLPGQVGKLIFLLLENTRIKR